MGGGIGVCIMLHVCGALGDHALPGCLHLNGCLHSLLYSYYVFGDLHMIKNIYLTVSKVGRDLRARHFSGSPERVTP
jgi:hypothetical protein